MTMSALFSVVINNLRFADNIAEVTESEQYLQMIVDQEIMDLNSWKVYINMTVEGRSESA